MFGFYSTEIKAFDDPPTTHVVIVDKNRLGLVDADAGKEVRTALFNAVDFNNVKNGDFVSASFKDGSKQLFQVKNKLLTSGVHVAGPIVGDGSDGGGSGGSGGGGGGNFYLPGTQPPPNFGQCGMFIVCNDF